MNYCPRATTRVAPTRCRCRRIHVLVEGDGHHTVRCVERFLNTVAVVDVDVEVQHAAVILEQLLDCDNDVIHVAKSACFKLFSCLPGLCKGSGNAGQA